MTYDNADLCSSPHPHPLQKGGGVRYLVMLQHMESVTVKRIFTWQTFRYTDCIARRSYFNISCHMTTTISCAFFSHCLVYVYVQCVSLRYLRLINLPPQLVVLINISSTIRHIAHSFREATIIINQFSNGNK